MQKAKTIILCTFVLLVGIASFIGVEVFSSEVSDSKEVSIMDEYQGPVRPSDDEQHFRETGITRPLEVEY